MIGGQRQHDGIAPALCDDRSGQCDTGRGVPRFRLREQILCRERRKLLPHERHIFRIRDDVDALLRDKPAYALHCFLQQRLPVLGQ